MTASKVEFHTSRYTMGHGKLPRGRGCWAFQVADITGRGLAPIRLSPPMTLTDAKAWMRPLAHEDADHLRGKAWQSLLGTVHVDILP